jgi:hypothetical protein
VRGRAPRARGRARAGPRVCRATSAPRPPDASSSRSRGAGSWSGPTPGGPPRPRGTPVRRPSVARSSGVPRAASTHPSRTSFDRGRSVPEAGATSERERPLPATEVASGCPPRPPHPPPARDPPMTPPPCPCRSRDGPRRRRDLPRGRKRGDEAAPARSSSCAGRPSTSRPCTRPRGPTRSARPSPRRGVVAIATITARPARSRRRPS